RARYPIPSWALITEVPNATSTGKTRSADALAIGCWKSVGIQMHGFEIKVARSDWLREIQDPSKALPFQRHCHHWWLVAAPKVVRVEEMPAEWGLMEPGTNGLRVKKGASLLSPELVTFPFLAALMRRAVQSTLDDQRIWDITRKAEAKALKEAE